MSDVAIRGRRILTMHGMRPACVHVRNGVITALAAHDDVPRDLPILDVDEGDVVMPGLVDTHVHVNEPGRTDWEGFESATRAAAAGGITTLLDMPLNSIPATTTRSALDAKRDAARGKAMVNVGFIGGVVPGNAHDLAPLHGAGVRIFKCFLVPSGVEEFPAVSEADLRVALPILATLDAPLLVHAELPDRMVPVPVGDPREYATYLASRPAAAETTAVDLMIALSKEFGAQVHIVHVSSAESVPLLREARQRGARISAETCPHYLTFAAEEIAAGATELKCAPPIRDRANREALWRALLDGDLEMVVSDHSPCPPEMKARSMGDFFQAWGGIASLQVGLAATWHEAKARGATLEQLSTWMSLAPARLAGVGHRKGLLAPGYDADLVIWNPDTPVAVEARTLYHRHPLTPYDGRTLTGAVRATYVGGVEVYRDGEFLDTPIGQFI